MSLVYKKVTGGYCLQCHYRFWNVVREEEESVSVLKIVHPMATRFLTPGTPASCGWPRAIHDQEDATVRLRLNSLSRSLPSRTISRVSSTQSI